ncbi:unnamed protein product [Staurois parvus]|uniref:C2H2-type domain-containing protein n=1 Tax=Staurois parvus TaxID=386267 RepID=A0ABN9DY73_9NEOB|nr:unnamed protein product [Staurois parvus]
MLCSGCGKYFRCFSELVSHKRTHTGETHYSFLVRKSLFTKAESLRVRTHSGNKPHSCSSVSLATPISSNTSESTWGGKPFSGSECGKFSLPDLTSSAIKRSTMETGLTLALYVASALSGIPTRSVTREFTQGKNHTLVLDVGRASSEITADRAPEKPRSQQGVQSFGLRDGLWGSTLHINGCDMKKDIRKVLR